MTRYAASELSSSGLAAYPAFSSARVSKASEFTRSVPPGASSAMFAVSAAGFIATRTFGMSPGVRISWSEMWTWNDETPAIVPASARISAGKFGIVARSLPNVALTSVKRSPTSCMPSPESPAKRITTRSRASGRLDEVVVVSAVTRPRFARAEHPARSLCCGRGPEGPTGADIVVSSRFDDSAAVLGPRAGPWRNRAPVAAASHVEILVEAFEGAFELGAQRANPPAITGAGHRLGLELDLGQRAAA